MVVRSLLIFISVIRVTCCRRFYLLLLLLLVLLFLYFVVCVRLLLLQAILLIVVLFAGVQSVLPLPVESEFRGWPHELARRAVRNMRGCCSVVAAVVTAVVVQLHLLIFVVLVSVFLDH